MGKSSSCVYDFKTKGGKVSIHGDDIVCAGEPEDLDWLPAQFEKKFEIRVQELSTPCEVQKNVTWTEGPDAGCK
eukprot:8206010-Heterocapsa_arctica.AAC.1